MRNAHTRVGLIAAAAALIGTAACNRSGPVADDGLERDLAAAAAGGLELAPSSTRSQVVVSPIEAGPTSAPRRASPKRTPTPAPRPTTRVGARHTSVVASAPAPVETAPVAAPPVAQPAPITRPVPVSSSHGRVYKTEAEIFRDMPWIRP